MAGETAIAKYYAELGIRVNRSGLGRADKFLKELEAKLKGRNGFVLNLTKFNVDQVALTRTLGNAMDIASNKVAFEVSKFVVNDRNLQAALIRAGRRAGNNLPTPNTSAAAKSVTMPVERSLARQTANQTARMAAVGGGVGAFASRAFYPIAALAAGGYGLSSLNQRNQQVVSAQLQSQAVVQQAGGTASQGTDSFNWLRAQGNRIGFNYLDASGDYNKLLSGLTGAGMSVKQGQDVFKGFSELSRVNKLDRVQQQRVYRALSQVAGKNRLQSEELTGQLARIWPLAA